VCHIDHPADTEFVGDHAEARREERLNPDADIVRKSLRELC